jgi:steroid delta-isomerase-like uncharacterized protein
MISTEITELQVTEIELKAAAEQYFQEVWNNGNLSAIDDRFAIDYIGHNVAGLDVQGIEGLKQSVISYRNAFPDITFTIEDQITEGEKVMSRWTARGTNVGQLNCIPGTGKTAVVTGITIHRYSNGKCVEGWDHWDNLTMLQQLEVIPPL